MVHEQVETLDTTKQIRDGWRRSRRRQRALAACLWAGVALGLCWLLLVALSGFGPPA